MAKLTVKQKKFADLYIKTTEGTKSYMAVYKCRESVAAAAASRLLKNVKVGEYIEERNKQLDKSTIADMQEIKEYWSKIVRQDGLGIQGGLKASEYIAKTNAAFIDKSEIDIHAAVKIVDDINELK